MAVVASLTLGGFLGFKFYFKPLFEKKLLVLNAKEYNKKCPVTYSDGVRVDSVTVQSDSKFEYHSTLINVEKENFNLDSFINVTEKRIVGDLKKDSSVQPMRDNNITLGYTYRDRNGKLLYEISVTPEMYSKK